MSWDEKATRVANALYPKDCDRDHLRRIGCMTGFNYGVGAALTALSDDEAVERVADGILASFAEVIEAQDRRLPPTTDVQRRHAEKYARAAITALLGEDT